MAALSALIVRRRADRVRPDSMILSSGEYYLYDTASMSQIYVGVWAPMIFASKTSASRNIATLSCHDTDIDSDYPQGLVNLLQPWPGPSNPSSVAFISRRLVPANNNRGYQAAIRPLVLAGALSSILGPSLSPGCGSGHAFILTIISRRVRYTIILDQWG